ncbi:MAG: flagellar hook-associated protein FlgL [Desulfuromonadaceae bacterium]|nr:flagellar hook-associated protein FlgL [Desulfuromonas sp.]MDY0185020.1 flagellar hook-associated protein FlgL [Desulfuromonadaceae bacterium]
MKSTLSTTYRSLNSEMSRLTGRLEDLRNQAATGKKLIKPSDDPSAIRPVLSARSQIRATDRFITSLANAGDRLSNQDSYLDEVENLMVQAKEVTLYAINGSLSDQDLHTLADDIKHIKTMMLGAANAQVGGQYIFGGYKEDALPFVRDGEVMAYAGDSNIKRLEASPGEYVQTNLPGNELFLGQTDLDGDGVMQTTGYDLFSMLTDLERSIRGEAGQVYNGNEVLPTPTIGYADSASNNYTPVLMDGGAPPSQILDNNGDSVPLVHAGKPISMQLVLKDNGDRMTIAEYSQKYAITVNDIGGSDISMSTAPMYLHANGDIPAFNTAGTPILAYTANDGTPAAISLLNSDDSPLQLRTVPDLQTMLTDLENGADQVRSKRGLMGNNAARLENSKFHLEGVRIDLRQILSRYEDVDILHILTEIVNTETAFEGALKVTGQVSRLSILDYM